MTNHPPLLEINQLGIHFGQNAVVRDLSLTLHRGETLALVGESGSGKSLTALSILKLLPPESRAAGVIDFDGTRISDQTDAAMSAWRGARIGMVFQEPMSALNPLHTIDRQILEPLRIHEQLSDSHAHAKLAELYAAVGLSHLLGRGKLYPHQLSGGERQRAMIAMAIACSPDLLIADEPTTALDVTLQQQILHLLKRLQRERTMALLLITHDLNVVRRMADRVAVMRRGEVVETAHTEALFTHPQHPYTRLLLDARPSGSPAPIADDAPEVLNATIRVDFPVKSGLLRRSRRHITAVNDIPLQLRAGETLGIVGESGSGKSSLAYALLRLIPASGPVVLLGKSVERLSSRQFRPLRRHLQMVFQDPYGALNPRMTVGEIITEGLGLVGSARDAIASSSTSPPSPETLLATILTQVGLTPEMAQRYPHEFSGGQRQRIAIARAMILRPAIVILDEPTSALDASVQVQVLDLLQQIQRESDVAYLFISHDLATVKAMAHRVLVMRHGSLVEQGACAAVFSTPQQNYTRTLLDAAFAQKPSL